MSQPRRQYPPDELALFAESRVRREPYRPAECSDGEQCWVRDGPPSITPAGRGNRCTGCGAPPRPVIGRRLKRES